MLSTLYLALTEAVRSLIANKMRSFLTVLGIVIGVAAVIALLAIGRGAQAAITGSIEGLGTNLIFVAPGNSQDPAAARSARPMRLQDVYALQDPVAAPSVRWAVPLLQRGVRVSKGDRHHNTLAFGTTPEYQIVRNYGVSEGEFFTQTHLLSRAPVVLLGPKVAETLFDRTAGLVGETVHINGHPFRVIGVLEAKGGGGFGPDQDDRIILPITAMYARLFPDMQGKVDGIMVSAVSPEAIESAKEEIRQILRLRHRLRPDQEDDFTIFTQQEFLQVFEVITGVLTIFLGGIAAISLLVGGIGIMNIMLVSVTERTREIGLRKALGARKRDILVQFLTEATLLSLVGGLVGIALGWGLAAAVERIAARFGTALPAVVDAQAVLLATLFSAGVGIFFGFYPANRAANLEPVEALRYE